MLKKVVFIILGTTSLILGVIGIVLPLLPTTPFLLLASFFYLRSSKRLYNKLMHHPILGKYIYNYVHYHAIPKKSKTFTILLLWITLSIGMFITWTLWIFILLCCIGSAVTIHLLKLRNLEDL